MINRKKNIDDLSKDLLLGFQADAPIDAWDNIVAGLNKKKKKAFLVFYKWAAAIAIILSIAGGYFVVNKASDNSISEDIENIAVPKVVVPVTEIIPEQAGQLTTSKVNLSTDVTKKKEKNTDVVQNPVLNIIQKEKKSIPVVDFQDKKTRQLVFLEKISGVIYEKLCFDKTNELEIDYRLDQGIANRNNINQEKESNNISKSVPMPLIIKRSESLWAIGGAMSPVYSYRNIIQNSSDPVYDWGGGESNELNEEAIVAFAGGIDIEYSIDKLSFSTGLYYSQMGQHTSDFSINRVFNYNTNPGVYASTSLGHIVIQQSVDGQLHNLNLNDVGNYSPNILESSPVVTDAVLDEQFEFVEFPLIAKYKLIDSKVDVSFMAGLSTGVLVGSKTTISYLGQDLELESYNNLRKINYNSLVGIGFQYPFSPKMKLRLQPVFKYALNSLNEDYSVGYYPYSFAVYTGFYYDF